MGLGPLFAVQEGCSKITGLSMGDINGVVFRLATVVIGTMVKCFAGRS